MNDKRLIRLPQVENLTGLRRAHLYNLARLGQFPKPLKIGARASAWQESLVLAWIQDRVHEAQDSAGGLQAAKIPTTAERAVTRADPLDVLTGARDD